MNFPAPVDDSRVNVQGESRKEGRREKKGKEKGKGKEEKKRRREGEGRNLTMKDICAFIVVFYDPKSAAFRASDKDIMQAASSSQFLQPPNTRTAT